MPQTITPGQLDTALLQQAAAGGDRFVLAGSARPRIEASVRAVRVRVSRHEAG